MTAALDTYAELHLAEGKLLRWGEREAKAGVALQARDVEILVALARYRFLTTGQIAELWWDGRGLRAVRRRVGLGRERERGQAPAAMPAPGVRRGLGCVVRHAGSRGVRVASAVSCCVPEAASTGHVGRRLRLGSTSTFAARPASHEQAPSAD